MADQNNTGSIADVVETDAPKKPPEPKKQRAPRRSKATAEATGATPLAKTAKMPRGVGKRGEQAGDAKPARVETQVAGKSTAKDIKDTARKRTAKQTERSTKAPIPAANEMADLVQLEEENKRLRKTLTDKLRAENADLRRRLGLD
ncbi:SyrB-like regulator (plasmid) [Rhizobium sp. CC1099]|uniref:SyrB-like regulator n=1 Tax=Rhizobium sp. CC1099 TaxID=3039160 RepID=UPI0024B18EB3|nr:SyrB-like regulator [Rhizobium sp. CC1099]WFU92064.1 SyrB-like regulator [Rhizobium sp. CC1099]